MPWESIITAVVSIVGTGFGLKLLDYWLKRGTADSRQNQAKELKFWEQTDEFLTRLQDRITVLETSNAVSHAHEIECHKSNAVLQAKINYLELEKANLKRGNSCQQLPPP